MKSALFALVSCVAVAQTFDQADVHVSKPGTTRQGGMIPGSGRMEFRGFSLSELIQFAYNIDDDMITSAPKWLGFSQFDVFAKGKRGSSDETMRAMLRVLLADRFKLVFHSVDKPMPAFVMTVGKRNLMKEAPEGEDSDCQPKSGGNGEDGSITLECTNISMPVFAERFHRYAGGYLTHPVVDQTGLKGGYDFTIRWTGRQVLDSKHEGISFFEAAEKQLGIKITETKAPLAAMAIDSVNEVPTPNAPGVKENLPVEATEFEVAVIKKSAPGTTPNGGFKPGGRIDFQAISIKDILPFIFDVDTNQMIGIPKFLDDKYNIVAKAPESVGIDGLKVMLRALFIEQFKMEMHKEEQQVPVWVMTVSKRGLKMEKAGGADSTGCKPGGLVNDLIHFTCKGTTMAQFGEQFHRYAGGYLDHAVVDETGLTDRYNFELNWTPRGRLQTAPAAGAGVAADPGGLSFFEAADRQLGLKFETQKRPMQVIVIDKASPLVAEQ